MPAPSPQSADVTRLRELATSGAQSPEAATLRLEIMRREFPAMVVQIDAVRADDAAIAVKATIAMPDGARHSIIASTDVPPGVSWSEQLALTQAEAISKALDGLGYPLERWLRSQAGSRMAPTAGGEDHIAEYSWNAFWQLIHARKITREQVDQALGKSVREATPKEAVAALQAAGLLPADA